MKRFLRTLGVLAALSALAVVQSVQGALVHRYSFDEAVGATNVQDSVGTAHGILKGEPLPDYTGTGMLHTPGQGTSAANPVTGYVDLPNHLINVHTNLTIETWVTYLSGGIWSRIFDLGTSAGGEDVVNGNGAYMFLSPVANVNLRFAVREPVSGNELTQLTSAAPLEPGSEVCLTVTYDYGANVCRLYSNAVLLVTGTASIDLRTINDVNNWLGRSQWDDNMFEGNYNEFRIYDTALNPVEVAASMMNGAPTPSTDPAVLGAVQAVHLVVPVPNLTAGDSTETTASVDFAALSGLNLAGVSGVTYSSDNTAVATVSGKGVISAVAAGSANVTLSYGGQTDSAAVTVSPRLTGLVVAGTLHVDLHATDTSTDAQTWRNRAAPGAGDFFAEGTSTLPVYTANVAGTGVAGVTFDGTQAYTGPTTTDDVHSGDRSIEVWAFNPAVGSDETMVAMGHRGGPAGSNLAFGYGANPTWGAVGHWDTPDMGWSGTPDPGVWHYFVYTYDTVKAQVYADGLLRTREDMTLATHPFFPFRIGAQGNTLGDAIDYGQALSGSIALVRVHGGVLSAADVANNFLFGVEQTLPGELQSVTLKLNTNTLYGAGTSTSCGVTATYANRNYLYVKGQSTFASSRTDVATIDAAGNITATGLGETIITATYQGKQGTATLTVAAPPAAVLVHRYSFSETVGSTTVNDSVGTAHGTIKGNGATLDGAGKLTLPGGTTSNVAAEQLAGYVDLPNGIISSLVNASFETWVSWTGAGGDWQRIFDFGTSDGGEDVANGNGNYLFMCVRPAQTRWAVRDPATAGEPGTGVLNWPTALPANTETHMVVVYDNSRNVATFYSNAVQVVSGTAGVPLSTIRDVNNWLGRSQWDDAMFQGTYNEFRIWDGAMTAADVSASYAAGPNNLPSARPTLTPSFGTAGSIQLTFTGGVLVSSDSVNGAYTPVAGATSPFTVTTTTGTKFFQIRNP